MVKALVTGGCGFIGSHLVKKLLEEGWKVTVVDDLSSGYLQNLIEKDVVPRTVLPGLVDILFARENLASDQTLVITADMSDPDVIKHIMQGGYTHVFHLAANPRVEYSVENPTVSTDTNLFKTVALAEMAAKSGVEKFVFASSSAVYGSFTSHPDEIATEESFHKEPKSPYGLQKLCSEMFLKQFADLYGLKSTALRFFNVYGPGCYGNNPYATAVAAWCDKLKQNQPLRSDGDGEQTRDMVYVGDVVNALVTVASEDTGDFAAYNVGYGKSLSNNQILQMLKDRFGDITITHAPERPGDVKHTKASIEAITEETSWKPQTDFETGLESTLAWWELTPKKSQKESDEK